MLNAHRKPSRCAKKKKGREPPQPNGTFDERNQENQMLKLRPIMTDYDEISLISVGKQCGRTRW